MSQTDSKEIENVLSLYSQGKFKDAAQAGKKLFYEYANTKEEPYIAYALARAYEKSKDYKKAQFYYQRAKMSQRLKILAQQGETRMEKHNESIDPDSQLIGYMKPFKSKIKFDNIVGLGSKDDSNSIKGFLYNHILLAIENPELFKEYNIKRGIGIILYGPTGTGKSFLAKAVAGEADIFSFNVQINQVLGQFVGTSEKNVATLFEQARNVAPSIMIFDELDALGGKRVGDSGLEGSSDTSKKIINELLSQMRGIENNTENLFIIGTTNLIWELDPAIKSSGRFGDALYIPPPAYKEREALFRMFLRETPQATLNYGRLARATIGYSQADIERICNHASIHPMLKKKRTGKDTPLMMKHLLAEIGKNRSSLDVWYLEMRNKIFGKVVKEQINGKVVENWKEGIFDSEEKMLYEDMIKDVDRNTTAFGLFHKRMQKFIALVLW